ncbi:nucleotidyltransferase domain-containing protein [Rossellomorea aquimaris]|uniref:nucleotidyltransferase domain-containing protein n=1 Tax=Rossellomorea aquimaris TaxID=189382 RepID=UPI001CD3525C|nr:nucleotidyltransferase domain-containing protein [Rossellomorea aquimaris]MCA1060270.1 nucleotidyltransferase domain-containing protein [Rossellomorea aquimaris]
MRQETAVEKVLESLKQDPSVRSVFLKGSMGRNEHDEHSDIDLYCLVKEGEEKEFLTRRLDHLKAYKDLIFHDDIFIIAPQIIAIYEDWLHIDLFTVTEKTFQEKDFFTVLYDPEHLMEKYESSQNLTISKEEFTGNVLDAAWFLFQHGKAAARGNHTWAVEMLRHSMRNVTTILLARYVKERAVLGLKTIHRDLPQEVQDRVVEIYEEMTPSRHGEAAKKIASLLESEFEWIREELGDQDPEVNSFVQIMIDKVLLRVEEHK